jgi:small subunit ribosomal protein S18
MTENATDTAARPERTEKRPPRRDGKRGGGDRDRSGSPRRKGRSITKDPEFIVDYKKPHFLQAFVTEHGKVVPRRISGVSAKEQRRITVEVKRARQLALLGYTSNQTAQ